ncbi:hypothetical protein MHH67_19330 [Bacillus sp. FSL K6-0047]
MTAYAQSPEEIRESFLLVLNLMLFLYICLFILWLIAHLIVAAALSRMAKNTHIQHPWLSWIPIAQFWIVGELISGKLRGNGGIKVLLIGCVTIVFRFLPFHQLYIHLLVKIPEPIYWFVSITLWVLLIYIVYCLYEAYAKKAWIHTVLSIIPFYAPIALFVLRNRERRY